jgi:hypothetical protein
LIVLYETKKRFRIRFKSLNPLSIKNGLERHLFFPVQSDGDQMKTRLHYEEETKFVFSDK